MVEPVFSGTSIKSLLMLPPSISAGLLSVVTTSVSLIIFMLSLIAKLVEASYAQQRLAARNKAHDEGAWVREAAIAYAEKKKNLKTLAA